MDGVTKLVRFPQIVADMLTDGQHLQWQIKRISRLALKAMLLEPQRATNRHAINDFIRLD
eukprot:5677684-Pleurochrysis_carterae.AAC.1